MRLRAMAKINLGLDVLGKRADGYHDLRTVMQTVYMYDTLDITMRVRPGIIVETNLPFLPVDKGNLVYRAAQLLMDEFDIKNGLHIRLDKHIPVAAGMAGGSADAAAVLVGVNRMFRLGLSRNELMERGVRLGADVPYCVLRGTALAEGIGEKLTPLPPAPDCHVLIAKPPVNVSTRYVYEHLRLGADTVHPDIDGLLASIKSGNLQGMAAGLGNVLESVTVSAWPVIGEIRECMLENGALGALMSGSGPTVFGLYADGGQAKQARDILCRSGKAKVVYLTKLFHSGGSTRDE
ncbi:MAG TPA: 4-(cytidine 5'-diphospho)-2-C-methyl-D-erythritol kinase [Lachnospiraceae bacterium]|nr:4-(cytidine 5'-diphospho)-2-C-methyl-D-erythritol kinase [Lachnospiraceae bacterium]